MNIFCAVRNRRENAWDYSKNHGAIFWNIRLFLEPMGWAWSAWDHGQCTESEFEASWVVNLKGGTLSIRKLYIANSGTLVYTKTRNSIDDTNASNKCTIHTGRHIGVWCISSTLLQLVKLYALIAMCILTIQRSVIADNLDHWQSIITSHESKVQNSLSLSFNLLIGVLTAITK